MNQRGFATLEVILMVMVIGILASIAVPRFNSVTAAANTAKIQADLSTIDTAIAIYYMDHGEYPAASTTGITSLSDYINDAENLKPPSGKCYVNNKENAIERPAENYSLKKVSELSDEVRAQLGDYTAEKFVRKRSS